MMIYIMLCHVMSSYIPISLEKMFRQLVAYSLICKLAITNGQYFFPKMFNCWTLTNLHLLSDDTQFSHSNLKRFFKITFFFRKYGILGLFKGLEAKLLQTVLTAALMFLLYEKIASCTFQVMGLGNELHKKH